MTPAAIRQTCDAQQAEVRAEHRAVFGPPQLYFGIGTGACRYPQCSCDTAFLAIEPAQQKEAA